MLNPALEREWIGTDEETQKYKQFIKQADNFTKDIMTGFTFDPTPVKNEVVLKKIQNELQKQVDAFLAK